jgi:hypothetical protein
LLAANSANVGASATGPHKPSPPAEHEGRIGRSRFSDLDDWSFAAMASLLGGHGERVTTRRELKDGLERAMVRRGLFFRW